MTDLKEDSIMRHHGQTTHIGQNGFTPAPFRNYVLRSVSKFTPGAVYFGAGASAVLETIAVPVTSSASTGSMQNPAALIPQ